MHDIKYIRDNSEDFDAAMARRGLEGQSAALLTLDEERRGVQTELQDLQAARNEKSKSIGDIKKSGGDADAVMAEVSALKDKMAALEERERTVAEALKAHLAGLPNIMDADVPDGADEADNVELRVVGDPLSLTLQRGKAVDKVPEHFEIGAALGMFDAEVAAKMSGARFTMLSGDLARMERALAQFMLDVHTGEHGLMEVSPPLLVRDNALYGTGQLPKFEDDLFKTEDHAVVTDGIGTIEDAYDLLFELKNNNNFESFSIDVDEIKSKKFKIIKREKNRWLIPTSEVPLTNIVADSIVEEESLPRRYVAHTPCFRSEAGSAGRDTRGMLRQHQFYKVEMVSVVKPEDSAVEQERMLGCAEAVLTKLGLAFRTVVLCSGDTGFGARKTFDIEVWLPGQEAYREVSSVSNCGDFQARRMNARYKNDQGKNVFVHTLNGSGVAVGRALIAVMENYYDPSDGGIFVPEVLKPYMGGVEKIVKA